MFSFAELICKAKLSEETRSRQTASCTSYRRPASELPNTLMCQKKESILKRQSVFCISKPCRWVLNFIRCHQDHVWSEGKHKHLMFSFKDAWRLPVLQKWNLWLKSSVFRVIHNILNYSRIMGFIKNIELNIREKKFQVMIFIESCWIVSPETNEFWPLDKWSFQQCTGMKTLTQRRLKNLVSSIWICYVSEQ